MRPSRTGWLLQGLHGMLHDLTPRTLWRKLVHKYVHVCLCISWAAGQGPKNAGLIVMQCPYHLYHRHATLQVLTEGELFPSFNSILAVSARVAAKLSKFLVNSGAGACSLTYTCHTSSLCFLSHSQTPTPREQIKYKNEYSLLVQLCPLPEAASLALVLTSHPMSLLEQC